VPLDRTLSALADPSWRQVVDLLSKRPCALANSRRLRVSVRRQ
jgi:hypothetical protein